MAIVLAIPQVTFGLVAGVYVDRLDRKKIMIVSDLLRGLLVLGFTLVSSRDQLWLLYLIGFLSGARTVGGAGAVGSVVFYFLVGMQILLVSFVAPAFTVSAISSERERQ